MYKMINAQCSGERLRLELLDLSYLLRLLRRFVRIFVAVVPMHVLVLLPAARRCIDTMPQIVLYQLISTPPNNNPNTLTSRSLSADTSAHLNSACPPRVPPRTGSNMLWDEQKERGVHKQHQAPVAQA